MPEAIAPSEEVAAEREALFRAWKYTTDHYNDPTVSWAGAPPFKFAMDFQPSAPHAVSVDGQSVELPEGYSIAFGAKGASPKSISWLQRSKNKPVDASTFAKAFEGIFSRRGITPDVRITDEGVWVNAATIDALIERGVYRVIDHGYDNKKDGHIFAEGLKMGEMAGFNKLLNDVHAVLEHGHFDSALAELDYNRGEDGEPRPLWGHHHKMDAPLVRVTEPNAARYVENQLSPSSMMSEMSDELRELTARGSKMIIGG